MGTYNLKRVGAWKRTGWLVAFNRWTLFEILKQSAGLGIVWEGDIGNPAQE